MALSYLIFLAGSLSVSYASWISWKLPVAASFVLSRSGWALRAAVNVSGGSQDPAEEVEGVERPYRI